MNPKYKRVLIKLSGEALANKGKDILDFNFIEKVALQIKRVRDAGVQVAVICGAGNIWRGRQGGEMDRCRADNMGMLATTINAIALQDTFIKVGLDAVVMSSVALDEYADKFTVRSANKKLERGKVIIFAGGLGSPYFSTDTAAALRAAEIQADCILLAKNIDAIYDSDPLFNPNAKRYCEITYKEMIDKNLKALDMSSSLFCMENNINGYAFGLSDPENIYKVCMGESIGTEIHN